MTPLTIGDTVVTMSYPGLFTIVGIDGDTLTIADASGTRRVVLATNVRRLRSTTAPQS